MYRPGAIIVPDARLLFTGDFRRSGVDLALTGDDHELVLHDHTRARCAPRRPRPTARIVPVDALTAHTQMGENVNKGTDVDLTDQPARTSAANPAVTLVTVDVVFHNVQGVNLSANNFVLHVT